MLQFEGHCYCSFYFNLHQSAGNNNFLYIIPKVNVLNPKENQMADFLETSL